MDEYVCSKDRLCYGCKAILKSPNFQLRIKTRDLLRIKVDGEMRTFHKRCFKIYKIENPEWAYSN